MISFIAFNANIKGVKRQITSTTSPDIAHWEATIPVAKGPLHNVIIGVARETDLASSSIFAIYV